ncbi:NAD(P)-binding protein [Jatrophihabitans telluris]|uniref:NAD(P)-binding protein n=1 Tax=Jatrophihabitans telluris TaxID=2038343 RepID=UPI003221BB45
MTQVVEADYLVVGAGAAGMAFTDALITNADVSVAVVDRRHSVGGHWLTAYPFVRLHQASAFYGVASTLLGAGRVQDDGPEAGLQERATAPEICAYYARVLTTRMLASGKVRFFPNCEYTGDRQFVSRVSGRRYEVEGRCRLVDAHYLSPHTPADTPPPFGVGEGGHVVAVNELINLGEAPSLYVVVGAGKTATDACIWLLSNGVDPDSICWVRPRDPWMLNRAVVQPDPAIFMGMAADIFAAAARASSADDLFLRLEADGVMIRIDRSVTPTMAKTPTLATWELDLLRSITNVVRLGHIRWVEPGRLLFDHGTIDLPPGALVVHCAASGLRRRPLVPIWRSDMITLQLIRAGFPCFAAALAGYVEATRDEDVEKNRLCPPSPYSNSARSWARMQLLGARAAMAFATEADIKAWADQVPLNPARIAADTVVTPGLTGALDRYRHNLTPGLVRLAQLAGEPATDRPPGTCA